MSLKVTILGSGTSTGVPVLGCQCQICGSNSERNMRLRASIMLEYDHGLRIVIDTGTDFRQQMLRAKVSHLQYVLYTHLHADHIHGFDDLRGFYFNGNQPITCFLDADYANELKTRFHYAFENTGYLGGRPDIRLTELPKDFGIFQVENCPIETMQLPHGNVLTNAFRFGSFAYATDFKSFPSDKRAKWRGKIDTMVASGLRWRDHKTHSTIQETIDLFEDLQVRRGIITHLNHEIDYDLDSKKLPGNVELAFDGMQILI
ncbi:MAG: MBL fold metallo-hydrolase [Proteobacteria bacterium]|nr:MBL fold metallo-hydrolase [Pseudomonadota bacterium]